MRRFLLLVPVVLLGGSPLRAEEPAAPPSVRTLTHARYLDGLKGGWAGQMIGVSYGSVYEFKALGKTIDEPIRPWKPEFVANSIQQDDIYVEMTFLATLQKHGINPTPEQVGIDFRDSKYALWHANRAGRVNLRAGITPPESGHPSQNPHSDDIDFQIEADLFGLIAPGLFDSSMRLCDRFGSIMNYGDGLYGGRFIAGMYAQAYLETAIEPGALVRIAEAGLACIPAESTYAQAVRDVLAAYRSDPQDWKTAWTLVERKYGQDDQCPEGKGRPFNIDAKVNGAYVLIGILYGNCDFERTMEIATRCGQDADCNPSSSAGVLGTLLGYELIPERFRQGIPALTGQKFSFTDYDFPALLAASEQITLQLLAAEGGQVREAGVKILEIPIRKPSPPAKLEQLTDFPPADLDRFAAEYKQREARYAKGAH